MTTNVACFIFIYLRFFWCAALSHIPSLLALVWCSITFLFCLFVCLFIAVFAFHPNKYVTPDTTSPDQWPRFFSLPVIYLMIITIINDGTLISIGYDNATPSKYPERWVLPVLFIVSISLGVVACLSSLILLYLCLDSWHGSSLFQKWHIGSLTYGQIVNAIFLKVAVSDILTLFSARTAHLFFFQRKPHWVLLVCTGTALCISTTLALAWPCSKVDKIHVCGLAYEKGQKIALWIWLYCIIVFLIQDCVKVATWRLIIHFNLFNVNNEVTEKDIKEEKDLTSDKPVEMKEKENHK